RPEIRDSWRVGFAGRARDVLALSLYAALPLITPREICTAEPYARGHLERPEYEGVAEQRRFLVHHALGWDLRTHSSVRIDGLVLVFIVVAAPACVSIPTRFALTLFSSIRRVRSTRVIRSARAAHSTGSIRRVRSARGICSARAARSVRAHSRLGDRRIARAARD